MSHLAGAIKTIAWLAFFAYIIWLIFGGGH